MTTLEGLGGLVLEIILSKLGPRNAAVFACVSTRLRDSAAADVLWRAFCSQDLDLSSPVDPDGNPCPSFKIAYHIWRESFGMYPWALVRRAKKCWSDIKNWMAENFPEAGETLQKGATEAEIKEVEERLGVRLPLPTRVLYRLCNGQETVTNNGYENERLAPLGIIGGYRFYDHVTSVHLLPLSEILEETREYTHHLGFSSRAKYIIVAVSYHVEKLFFLNCANGQLYVGTKKLGVDGEMLPCVPRGLIKSVHDFNSYVQQDAMLLWLEEHVRRLQSGMIRIREFNKHRSICLFPEAPPSCSIAVTNGVQVRASAVFVPELCDLNDDEDNKYWFSYSIRMSLLPEGCILDGIHYTSCQLYSRHWIIRVNENVVSDVHGEAVIGKFPLLTPNKEEFVYESGTPLPSSPGSIEGAFTFVPGRLRDPKGRQFDVEVARFPLEVPEYIF